MQIAPEIQKAVKVPQVQHIGRITVVPVSTNANHSELTATIGGPSDTVSRSSGRCDSRVATTALTIQTVQKTGEVQRLERSCGRARDDGSGLYDKEGTQRPFPQRSPRRPDRPSEVRAQRARQDPEWSEPNEARQDPTRSEAKGLRRTPKVRGCRPDSPRGESGR